ncbi:hypothetical protein pEaSNUABM40_00221 [Erwinia phage pEa_SNUABM_40]|uniref:Uncharacterized protein n=1 Tax=Erwinia phage pEa_SNUABM_3 TaxID=2869552 RepID=A0AAE7XJ19_9CAUD|nr:hypothetical protein MPK68_gp218 [Erwinia phage pEa_SNUABM_3]QZE56415.1 hypothetical protein pEaSNUABM3_00218 [Erwinia phage pEa_SNUABM_3]QZE58437.1 hypothetical protein pEaSNUABM40_00221 [Erwinia phage pEa_SNUABM_40]UAW52999.1 hypothetical protein pEaSNUABM23_00217 [Erwinia phage pEa_SNUABM_23]UIW10895.1 hypothetical protein pEaSNUABM23_00217 [Erwinia phage pEa_SNUABM_31]
MSPIEVLFRLEFKLSQSAVLPPSEWPELRSKKLVMRLIKDCPMELIAVKNKRLFRQYSEVLSAFDCKYPLTSLQKLASEDKYKICFARDLFSLLYPKRVEAFSKLHDEIWQKHVTDNDDWQADLENAEFAAMYGHVFDKFAEMGTANELLEKADFPWAHLKLKPV